SAPQKHPMPNMAFSKPAGYGPFNGCRLMKCSRAVGIGSDRPGNASADVGRALDFLNRNIAYLRHFDPRGSIKYMACEGTLYSVPCPPAHFPALSTEVPPLASPLPAGRLCCESKYKAQMRGLNEQA